MQDLSDLTKAKDYKGKKILIADSDFSSVRYAVEVLRKTGAEVISTNNGNDAVKSISEDNIDMIFVSMSLPLKSGYDVAREIRNLKNNKSRIPIIGCLTYDGNGETKDCIDAGCDNYMLKPIFRPQQFVDMVIKYLS